MFSLAGDKMLKFNILLLQLYDHDKDGILNLKETQKVLKCLGFRTNEEQVSWTGNSLIQELDPLVSQAKSLAQLVSCDRHGFSVSFNEYLTLVSIQRREPDEETLLDVFL